MKNVALVKEVEKVEEKQEVKPEKPKMSFSVWFSRKLQKKKVKFWQEEALLVFFKKQGLAEAEVEDQYDEVFERF